MPRVALVAVLAFGVTAAPRAAFAGDSGAWLRWSSPAATCGTAASFAARVERALGRSPAVAAGNARVNVTAHIAMATVGGIPRWSGEVRLRGDDARDLGSRALDRGDVSCQSLVDALAVVTALVLSDDGVVTPPEVPKVAVTPESPSPPRPASAEAVPLAPLQTEPLVAVAPAPPPIAPLPPAPQPVAPPVPQLTPRDDQPVISQMRSPGPRPSIFGVEAGAKVAVGLMPRMAFGAELSASVHLDNGWKFFLAFVGWEQQTTLDYLGRGASFQRLEGGLGVCPLTVIWNGWIGTTCARGDVGRLRVTGMGLLLASSTEDRLTVAAEAGIEVQRPIVGPLALGVTASALVPVIRDQISYTTDGVVGTEIIYRQALVAVVGAFRLSCAF